MLAWTRDVYGPPEVLRLDEIPRPTPEDDEVLVQVRASSLNRADKYALLGHPALVRLSTGLLRPTAAHRGVGMDFCGVVTAIGAHVTAVAVGDRVFGEHMLGQTWAAYACVPETLVARAPDGVDDAVLACLPLAGVTALQGLRDFGRLTPGQRVLVYGATGAVGPFAVQIAKVLGASHVSAVCSARNLDFVRSLGADRAVAYDAPDALAEEGVDIVFDVAGTRTVGEIRRVLAPNGTLVAVGSPEGGVFGPVGALLCKVAQAALAGPRIAVVRTTPSPADLARLAAMVADGSVRVDIDRRYPLAEAPEALRYLSTGHPRSKVVLDVADPG